MKTTKVNMDYALDIEIFEEVTSGRDIFFLETTLQKYVRLFGIPQIGTIFDCPDIPHKVSNISVENRNEFYNIIVTFQQNNSI
jgi:hypothetical protein